MSRFMRKQRGGVKGCAFGGLANQKLHSGVSFLREDIREFGMNGKTIYIPFPAEYTKKKQRKKHKENIREILAERAFKRFNLITT